MTDRSISQLDMPLWHACQRIVYPNRWPSENKPFPPQICGPKRKPASWLYHTLAGDAGLRAQVLQ